MKTRFTSIFPRKVHKRDGSFCVQSKQKPVVPWTADNENQSYIINPSTWNSRKT